ncbi:ChbG/HpnK family deacetylase [Pseudobacteriovorax antillogorgiicola]|uniref:YdjC-like protein n=1 Tax=Pseudobacteriovorax antillogorgiicola TaxID=1513793 RepID=A0A1Y6BL84_9BACT|nr:ChbG/HpnK family deacetylase [Pseudobacteriovorax antillogorgiicola]TCS54710.1 YdjC-like protein [Pseudobacteriovorax antillogorgiicola]SMF16167.1 YdjC-like protein [Pseudobacteriovorax antillogorgiicola]
MSIDRKRLIINVDDFGPSEEVSLRAIEAYQAKTISSVSAIINIDWNPKITDFALDIGIPMGIHLNYTSGKSTLLRNSSLVDDDHFFLNKNLTSTSHIAVRDLYEEFENQILRIKDLGINLTHIDNHKEQIYFCDRLFDVVFRLASEYSLPLRNPFRGLTADGMAENCHRYKIPEDLILQNRKKVRKISDIYQVKSPHRFINDIWDNSIYPSYLKRQLDEAPDLTELCVHIEGELGKSKLDFIASQEFKSHLDINGWVVVGYDCLS